MKKFHFRINGNFYEVELLKVEDTVSGITNYSPAVQVEQPPQTAPAREIEKSPEVVATPAPKSSGKPAKGGIKSPLPGIVRGISVKVGDKIKKHDHVLIVEAMKMDNNIVSEVEGTVTAINISLGEQVLEGDVLIEIGA